MGRRWKCVQGAEYSGGMYNMTTEGRNQSLEKLEKELAGRSLKTSDKNVGEQEEVEQGKGRHTFKRSG